MYEIIGNQSIACSAVAQINHYNCYLSKGCLENLTYEIIRNNNNITKSFIITIIIFFVIEFLYKFILKLCENWKYQNVLSFIIDIFRGGMETFIISWAIFLYTKILT